MIIHNNIYDNYKNAQDVYGMDSRSYNVFPQYFMNSDCKRFDKTDEILDIDETMFEIDKNTKRFMPKIGKRLFTFSDSLHNRHNLDDQPHWKFNERFNFGADSPPMIMTDTTKNKVYQLYDYMISHDDIKFATVLTDLYLFNWGSLYTNKYLNSAASGTFSRDDDDNLFYYEYIMLVYKDFFNDRLSLNNHLISNNLKPLVYTVYNDHVWTGRHNGATYSELDFDFTEKSSFEDHIKLSSYIHYTRFWKDIVTMRNYFSNEIDNSTANRKFNRNPQLDENTISMKPFEINYPDNTKYMIHREDSAFNTPLAIHYKVATDIDNNKIKPVDMFVGSHELMKKGVLPAFFMGINSTGMNFGLESWKKIDLIDTETNSCYTRQNKLSFSGFTGKRYALFNRTIIPYKDNDIRIEDNMVRNKDVAATILHKVCNGTSSQEWLSLDDCKSIIEANWQGGAVDLLDSNIHKEIDKRLFADIDKKFPKFLNYMKNMDIGVQSFMIEDLNNLAILMPYGKHTFIAIDSDENLDVDHIEFTINVDENLTEGNLYYVENIGWISYYTVAKIPNEDNTAYSYIVKFKIDYKPGELLDQATLDTMDNVTSSGFNARCFMVQSEYTHLFNNQTSFKQVPVISPLLFLGGAQVTEILGPVFQFNIDRMVLANKIKEFIDTYEVNFEDNDITNMCKYASLFTDDNTPRDIGALIHVLFTLYGPHGKWDFILDRMGAVVKADKIFDPVLTNLKNKFSLTDDAYKKFFEYYMTANQQYSPRKNPYAYLTKVDCYAANISNNFDSITDEFTFIGPMVDDKDVYDNFPSSKGWEPLMPHVNNGAVGFQAEMRAFIFNKDLAYKLDDMKHNVTNRWYTAPHSYTRKQYDMTNAYCVGSDFDVTIKPKFSFFVNDLDKDKFREIYKDKYTRFKYHILSPEYAYTQNTLTFGYRFTSNTSEIKIAGVDLYLPYASYEKIVINYHNQEYIVQPGQIINKANFNNLINNLQYAKIGDMIYISYVFNPNKEYAFQGFHPSLNDATVTKFNKFMSLNDANNGINNIFDLVSITGAFPRMSNKDDMYHLSTHAEHADGVRAHMSQGNRSNWLLKFFDHPDFSKVEVIGDRLFENWFGDLPSYLINKFTNLKVVPQSLYHSMFTQIVVLPPKVEVIPDYIWDNKYVSSLRIESVTNSESICYIIEPAGNTNTVFTYNGNIKDFAFTTALLDNNISPNLGTKGNFLMPWNEGNDRTNDEDYHDDEIRRVYTNTKNAFIGKQLVYYKAPRNDENKAIRMANKKAIVTILCDKYFKPMTGAAYNYHRSTLSDNIDGMKIGKMKFRNVVKFVSWVPNYFVGWQTDDLIERWLAYWDTAVASEVMKLYENESWNGVQWSTVMKGINEKLRQSSGIFLGNTNLTEDQKKLIQIKYHPKWYRNLIIFKPLRYGLDSISPDLLSKGAETPKSVYLSDDDITKRTKIPHTSNNTRWSEVIAYHPAWAFFNQIKGLNHDKLDYKQNFYEETLGNVLWINTGTNTEIYKHKYQYIPFENDYFGRSYKWSSGDKYNHFDIKSVLMSYIDKIVLPQRGSYYLGAGYGTNDMLWSENDGFQLKVNGATGIIGNIDPYDRNSQYYNYRDKTRRAKKQYSYRTGYKGIRILDTRQILANNYINFYSDTKYPINAYPEIIEDWSEQVAERGDQWLGYRSDTLKHANNLLMVYDYQKFMDSPFFERTDIGLENYGAYNRDYTKSAEFTPFPSPWNMSRRDGSGLITGMLVPPVFYVLGSNDNKNNEVKTLWSRRELPAFTDKGIPNKVEYKRNFHMVKNMAYSNSRFFNYNDITVYKRATNYDDAIAFMHTEKNMRSKGTGLFVAPPAVPNNPQSDTRSTFVLTKGDDEWNNLFLYCGFPSYISLENSINYSNKTYFDIYRRGAQYMSNIYNTSINITQPEIAAIASGPYERSEFRINVPTKYTVFMDYNNDLGQYAGDGNYMKNDDILDDIRWVDMYNGINNNSDCLPEGFKNYFGNEKQYIKTLLAQKNRPNVNNLNVMPDQFALNYKMASTPTVPALTSNYAISWRDAYYMHPCKIYEVSMSRTLGFRNVFNYHIERMPDNSGSKQVHYHSISTYNRFKQNYKFITDNDSFNISNIYNRNINRVISINRQGEMGNHLIATNYGRVLDKSKEWYAGINNNYNKDYIPMDYRNTQHGLNMSRNIINLSSINQYPEFVKMSLRGANKTVPYSDTIKTSAMSYYYNNNLPDNNRIRNNFFNILFMQISSAEDYTYQAANIPRITKFNIRTDINTITNVSRTGELTDGKSGWESMFDDMYSYPNVIGLHYTLLFANTAQKLGLTNGPTWWNIWSASNKNTRRQQESNQYYGGAFIHLTDYYTGTPANIIRWISTNGYYEGPIVYSVGSGEFMKIFQDTYNIATIRLHMNFNGMWNSSILKSNRDLYADPIIQPTSPNYRQNIPYREILTRTAHGWGGLSDFSLKIRYRDAVYGLWMYHDDPKTGQFTYGYNESTITNVYPGIMVNNVSGNIPEGLNEIARANIQREPDIYRIIEHVRALAGPRYNNKWTRHNTSAVSMFYGTETYDQHNIYNFNNLFKNTHVIFESEFSNDRKFKVISANNIFDTADQSNGYKSYFNIPKFYSYFPRMTNLSRPISSINKKYKTSAYLIPDFVDPSGAKANILGVDPTDAFVDQYTSNFENLYYNVTKDNNNGDKSYEGTIIDKFIPLNHYSYARDVYGFLNKVKADAPKVPVSVIESSQDKMYSRNTFSALTGLTFDIPATRSNPKDTLGVINIFEFEAVENGRQLNECTFEFYPLIDDPSHLVKEEGLSIEVNGVEILSGWDPINIIMENNTFIVEEINRAEITIKSAKYNWIVRVIPATNQNDKHEPVVKINLPFVCISDDSFTYQSLTRMNPFIDKYDIGGFVESYKAGGNNLANIVPLILTFGRIKEMPNNMFEEVRSKRNSNIGVSFISTFAGSHTKTKWNIDMLTPIRKVAELTDNEFHKIAALMFRMADNNDEDPVITQENSWINDGIEGTDAICGDMYELMYGNTLDNAYQVLESMPEEIKNEYLEKYYNNDDSWLEWCKQKITSNAKDHIVPLLFANCGNNNGFTVSTKVFQKYHLWCKDRKLSDKKLMFIGMFAGSYIKAVPQYLNGIDINSKIQYEDISDMPIWSASEPSKGHILFDNVINSIGKHKDMLNPNIVLRPHIVFMGYLPNDFTYAFCPLLVLNNDAIDESYIGTDTIVPKDLVNNHVINHRGQYINCTISGTLDIHRMLELYKKGNDTHIMQLSFGQFDTKQAFFNMIVRIDSSLSNKQIQTYSAKIIDLVKHVKVRFIPENAFRFKWFNSNNENKYSIYADYFLFGRKALINIINTGNEYLNPNNSYRRSFTNCINLERIPDRLIPMEYIGKNFPNFLSFIEMFNGCKTYIPTTIFRNPNNISSGFITSINVTNMFKDNYFIIEIDKDTNIVENMNGIDIKVFGKMQETTTTITEADIRKWKNVPGNYNIVFKEFIAHPEAEHNRWIPFFYCRVVMYCKIPK